MKLPHTIVLEIPFPSARLADIARQALSPDSEIKPGQVEKTLVVTGPALKVTINADSARMARVSLQAFIDNIEVIVRAMDELAEL